MAINWSQIAQSAFQGAASSAGGSMVSSLGSSLELKLNKWLNPEAYRVAMRRHLTGAEKEQNDFNAQQASLQRQWATGMTTQEWAREERLANTAMQRQVSDMQAAGINPALMYQNGSGAGAATPTSSPVSGVAASGSGNGATNLSDFIQLAKLGAETDLLKAQAFKVKKEGEGQEIDNANKPDYWNRQLELMGATKEQAEANIHNLLQQVQTGAADEALKRANARLTDANITQTDLQNGILALQIGMTKTDARYYDAMKSLDLALKSATVDGKEEEIKNLRKARALLQAQIVTEGSKSKLFEEQATSAYEFGRYTHKKTTWIDAEELEKLTNLGQNTELLHYLANKYDAEANYTNMKPFLELLETLSNFVGEASK